MELFSPTLLETKANLPAIKAELKNILAIINQQQNFNTDLDSIIIKNGAPHQMPPKLNELLDGKTFDLVKIGGYINQNDPLRGIESQLEFSGNVLTKTVWGYNIEQESADITFNSSSFNYISKGNPVTTEIWLVTPDLLIANTKEITGEFTYKDDTYLMVNGDVNIKDTGITIDASTTKESLIGKTIYIYSPNNFHRLTFTSTAITKSTIDGYSPHDYRWKEEATYPDWDVVDGAVFTDETAFAPIFALTPITINDSALAFLGNRLTISSEDEDLIKGLYFTR